MKIVLFNLHFNTSRLKRWLNFLLDSSVKIKSEGKGISRMDRQAQKYTEKRTSVFLGLEHKIYRLDSCCIKIKKLSIEF